MSAAGAPQADRVRVDGKFLRLGERKFWVKGITYGPFAPRSTGEFLPDPERIESDFQTLRSLGANTVRVYHAPPRDFLDAAERHGLKVFVDIPWSKHRTFLDSRADRETGRRAVRDTVRACRNHRAVLAVSVVNEIPTDVARWSGPARVERFIDELVDIARQEDPEALVTFASFPPTEYLHPQSVDFYTMNVYLHRRDRFRSYLERLQNRAEDKPLLLGEYGIDSIRHGEQEQADLIAMHLQEVFSCGLAGTCIFSYTDEWFTGGSAITDWAFGMVRTDRTTKPVFERVADVYRGDPRPKLPRYPRVSAVVCSCNGSRTIEACLTSLERVNYPDFELILIDDGSTDATPEIAARHVQIRYVRQANQGLSAARNRGLELATGEVVAYTDDDCRVDEDWLYFLVAKLLASEASAVGGPNLLPLHDGPVAACVHASPGTPAHVLIDDSRAEHIPGCNMAFWSERLRSIAGFDPVFTSAGDDVDVCWRLHDQGEHIVFSPAAMVWHHRRSTVRAYLRQQQGYGRAEALLKRKHPKKFQGFRNDPSWGGRIYARAGLGVALGRPVIHFGPFGTGMFQTLYAPPRFWWPLVGLSLEWWIAVVLLLGIALAFPHRRLGQGLLLVPAFMVALSLGLALFVAGQANLASHQRRWWSRLLIAALHMAQPVERAWARYSNRFRTIEIPLSLHNLRRSWEVRAGFRLRGRDMSLWSEDGAGREALIEKLLTLATDHNWYVRVDPGWSARDVRFYGDRWCKADLITVTENHGGSRRLTRLRLVTRATLFQKALLFLLGYLFLLGGLVDRRSAFALVPVLVAILWQLASSRRRLRRTVFACALTVAEGLTMTLVEAPDRLRRPAEPEKGKGW